MEPDLNESYFRKVIGFGDGITGVKCGHGLGGWACHEKATWTVKYRDPETDKVLALAFCDLHVYERTYVKLPLGSFINIFNAGNRDQRGRET